MTNSLLTPPTDIVLIIGLPGSGKSTLLSTVDPETSLVFDDLMKLELLPDVTPEGKTLYIASPQLCTSWKMAVHKLSLKYPHATIGTIFFENDVDQAIINVADRNDGRIVREHYIRHLSQHYVIPDWATDVHPVFR